MIPPKKIGRPETERQIEKKLGDAVKKRGGQSIKLLSTTSGLPDRLCLLPGGRPIFIELKAPGKKATPKQAYIHDQLRALGFQVEVVDGSNQITPLLDGTEK
jgi:hypothetical protein